MNELVKLNNGIATTTSLIIAEQFGRKHSHVMKSLEKLNLAGRETSLSTGEARYEIVPSAYVDESGKANKMYELTERQALIAMPFIGGNKSLQGQIALVDAFLQLRNNQTPAQQPLLGSDNVTLLTKEDSKRVVNAIINKLDRIDAGYSRGWLPALIEETCGNIQRGFMNWKGR